MGVLSDRVLNFLHPVVNGDSVYKTQYLSGPKLVELFSRYGFNDDYSQGFPSRWVYTLGNLTILNNKDFKIFTFIEDFLDPRKFIDKESDLEQLVTALNKVIHFDGYRLEKQNTDFYKFIKIGSPSSITNSKTLFEDIQSEIIKNIELSQYSIEIAVAWVTNDKIIQSLNKKHFEGVLISIIVNDDSKNRGKNYVEFPRSFLKITSKYENIMHHKFAIFDSQKVVSGSYNWTNAAEFNEENITIITDLIEIEKFKQEFKKLLIKARSKII